MLKKIMMLCLVLFSQQVISSDSRTNLPSSNKKAEIIRCLDGGTMRAFPFIPLRSDVEAWNVYEFWAHHIEPERLSSPLPGHDAPRISIHPDSKKYDTFELTEPGLSLLRQAMEKEKIAQKNTLSSSDDIE
jgi:hypothetical protein